MLKSLYLPFQIAKNRLLLRRQSYHYLFPESRSLLYHLEQSYRVLETYVFQIIVRLHHKCQLNLHQDVVLYHHPRQNRESQDRHLRRTTNYHFGKRHTASITLEQFFKRKSLTSNCLGGRIRFRKNWLISKRVYYFHYIIGVPYLGIKREAFILLNT